MTEQNYTMGYSEEFLQLLERRNARQLRRLPAAPA